MKKISRKRFTTLMITIAIVSFLLAVIFDLTFLVPVPFIALGLFSVYNYYYTKDNIDKNLLKYDKILAILSVIFFNTIGIAHALNIYYSDHGGKTLEIKIWLTVPSVLLLLIFIVIIYLRYRAKKKL